MTVPTPLGDYLIAATVCGGKDYEEDWSKPGTVFAYLIQPELIGPWKPMPILESIHRNHGLGLGTVDGVESLLVSGTEGLFALAVPGVKDTEGAQVARWRTVTILDHEVSEMGLIDLDGDGVSELVVIEPFHGDELAVYKNESSGWTKIYSAELSFGHGLSVGHLKGDPVVVVGNRAGSKDLVCYRTVPGNHFSMEPIVVDHAAAPAGTTITARSQGDGIVSSNPEFGEYAFYLAQ